MKTKKLNLYDFKAVGTQELLETKGGAQEIPSWSPHSTLSFGGKDGENGSSSGCCCGGQWGFGDGIAGSFQSQFSDIPGQDFFEWLETQGDAGIDWLNDNISGTSVISTTIGSIFGATAGALFGIQTVNAPTGPSRSYESDVCN
ncbi:MAG: hypothetical protein WBG90_17820 [Saonia sp.]